MRLPDHPDIARVLRDGYAGSYESEEYRCPECGEYLDDTDPVWLYDGEIVACKHCFIEDEFDPEDLCKQDAMDAFYHIF